MRLRHIEIFHAIYTTGSITNAAKLLHVSQPSVSKVLSHAELQLGFQLFSRDKGRLTPTPEAEMLFIEADRVFNQMSTINDLAENILHNRKGQISLATTPALGFEVIPEITNHFLSHNPGVKVNINTLHNHNLINHLLKQQSELAIMFDPQQSPDIKQHKFGTGKLVAVMPNQDDYPDGAQLRLKDIQDRPFISIKKSGPLADLVSLEVNQLKHRSKSIIQVDTYYIAICMVKQGLGWCMIDEFTAHANRADNIRILDLDKVISFPIVGLTSDLKPSSRITDAYIEQIAEFFSNRNKANN